MKPSADTSQETSAEPNVNEDSDRKDGSVHNSNGDSKIGELRRILIGSEEVSSVLPEAVSKSSQKSTELTEATLPIVEENIRESVLRNPKVLADALFPVIGPAIRKAISAALSSMVQSFNQTLEYSVSPKGLRWRLEAFRTGRSFGEVVMLKTLRYSVEQIFLIHRETGLLLQHVARNPQDTEDADMVSAMLTAITDFAHDSFKTSEDATLDSFKISGLSVWIENSPDVILAAAIRGNPPLELREIFTTAIEKVQFTFERELEEFEGESEIFARARPELERCLQFQAMEEKEAGFFSPARLMLGVVSLVLLLVVGYFALDYWRWSGLLEDIREEPGYVLTDYQRGWFTHSVAGLKDPLANGASTLLANNGYDEDDVALSWREYHDSNSDFVIRRAQKLLAPPDGVKLSYQNGILAVDGKATSDWFSNAKRFGSMISGVEEVRVTGESQNDPISSIERSRIQFKCGTLQYRDASATKEVAEEVAKLATAGRFDIRITGFADRTGTEGVNREISSNRAKRVSQDIQTSLSGNENAKNVKLIDIGSETLAEDCVVTFKVTPQDQ